MEKNSLMFLSVVVLIGTLSPGISAIDHHQDKVNEEELGLEPRTFDLTLGGFNSTIAITGTLIIGSLLLFSAVLYALDVYATSRIDRMLVDSFGPEIFERFSHAYASQDTDDLLAGTYEDIYEGSSRRRRRQASEETKITKSESRIMGLIHLAYDIYNAADESLREPECRKKLVCEVYSRPDDVLGEGYLGKTIKKGMEYLPYIQERYNVAAEILDGKKEAEEHRVCETKKASCDHLERVLNGMMKENAFLNHKGHGEQVQN
ncbi:uncharacterized protein [Lepeophtheirus salmonis]|uniref:Uncharacterized protein n=1 Tax=Lepeophtheirus salmonis TaxID=72036 RepID=A0A0K2U7D4_LEPSM|nr:uncharacterized protein LOC121118661 [Lepeophtheirus salmonis]